MERHRCCEVISNGDDAISIDEENTLRYAVVHGHLECVKNLVETGANINEKDDDDKTPLHYAAVGGRLECMEFLISNGSKIDEKDIYGRTPLYYAVLYDQLECIKFLISNGANFNEKIKYGKTTIDSLNWKSKLIIKEYIAYNAIDEDPLLVKGVEDF